MPAVAIDVKRRARKAHTVCGMGLARWDKPAHVTFIFFCFLTTIIVTSCFCSAVRRR